MSKFISLTWSEGVSEQESDISTEAISQVLRWLYLRHPTVTTDPPIQIRPLGNWVIPALVPDKPYWGIQWYIDSSYNDELRKVIAPRFLELVRQEPWQRADPHFDLTLLHQDLTDFPAPLARLRPDRYTLGSSLPGTAAILSFYRLHGLSDEYTRQLSVARLVRHHLGHVLAVPNLTRQEHVSRLGLELHCTNACVMRHAASVTQLAGFALQESEMGWPFCDLCTRELHSVIVRHAQNWN